MAGIGDAIDAPLRQYSTGMQARLGLAIATSCEPDLLLIDEVLAVGDEEFRTRAVERVGELRAGGTAFVFVSHEWALVEETCNRVVRLDAGRVVDDGPASEVIERAGGADEGGGVLQVTPDLRLDRLVLSNRRVAPHEPVDMDGELRVVVPAPHVRLELTYQMRIDRNPAQLTAEETELRTVFRRVVEPAGGRLVEPGWYRFRASVPEHRFRGELFVVVSAVDDLSGDVVAQTWESLNIGTRVQPDDPFVSLDAEWSLEDPSR
jgi:ABC-type multidrug transport system ATPase subunit